MPRKGQFKTHCLRGHKRPLDRIGKVCNLCRPSYDKKYFSKQENVEKRKNTKARWRRKHPEYDSAYQKRIRTEVLSHYGGVCACCKIDTYEFLSFDHVHGGGTKHRKELKIGGGKFAAWLKRNNYPKEYRVLCHNCNVALGMYGHCPHGGLSNND